MLSHENILVLLEADASTASFQPSYGKQSLTEGRQRAVQPSLAPRALFTDDQSGTSGTARTATDTSARESSEPHIVARTPRYGGHRGRVVPLQKWEGVVERIGKDSFWVRLRDLTDSRPDEEAEIPISEVSTSDRDLLAEGAILYWTIGYRDDLYGQRRRESVIRLRRLPAWTDHKLRLAKAEAERFAEKLNWH